MAKRGVTGLTKFKKLCNILNLPSYAALGVLESIWHLTAREAPRGDLGRLSDEDICLTLEWSGEPEILLDALVECGWLEDHDEHRLIVHDWHEHCDETNKKALKRRNLDFVTKGLPPPKPRARREKSRHVQTNREISGQANPSLTATPLQQPKPDENDGDTNDTKNGDEFGLKSECVEKTAEISGHDEKTAEKNSLPFNPLTIAKTLTGDPPSPLTNSGHDSTPSGQAHTGDLAPPWQTFQARYPKRAGGFSIEQVRREFNARCMEADVGWQRLLEGAERYRAYIEALGWDGTQYVMDPKNWLSRLEKGWARDWTIPQQRAQTRSDEAWRSNPAEPVLIGLASLSSYFRARISDGEAAEWLSACGNYEQKVLDSAFRRAKTGEKMPTLKEFWSFCKYFKRDFEINP